jgi:NhaP-type Na+/H+ or K+/H+ antiporter
LIQVLTVYSDEVVLGVVLGALIGIGFRHLMKFCERKDLIDRQSYVAQYVSLAVFTIGVTTLLGSDDLLAAFASGTAFAWDGFFNKQTEQSVFSSVIDLLFNVAAFVYIGAWMPFDEFNSSVLSLSVGRLVAIAILVLLLRRLPIIIALYRWIPDIKTFREAVFSGHFGPMGVGAVFISTLAKTRLPPAKIPPNDQVDVLAATIQPIVAFMVLCSIVTRELLRIIILGT